MSASGPSGPLVLKVVRSSWKNVRGRFMVSTVRQRFVCIHRIG